MTYTYNVDGLRASTTYPDTKAFTYSYSQRNQLSEIEFNLLVLNPLVSYTYDLAGRRTMREMNNSEQTEYTYDDAGRPTLIEQKNAGGTFDRRDYGYTVVNNRKWEKRDSLLGDAYTYDVTGQLTGVKYDATTPEGTPASPLKQTAFDFDAVGNREVVTQTTGTNSPVNTSYTANSLNQYTVVGGGSVTSDTNGNLTTYVGGTNAYDAQNRLISASSGTNAVSLAYDGLNRVVSRTVSGTATHFVYDQDWNVIEEYDNGGTQLAAMAYGATTDEPIFRWASGYILSYYHQDVLGNVTALTDLSGIPVESYRYDAFGKATIYDPYLSVRTVSFFGNPYMFTGREFVPEVGIYLYRNRAYSAEFGRFLQTDPIGFWAGDVNLYRYVDNNPINAVDPWGLATVHYWPATPGHYGHISITLKNGTYISNWPDGGFPPFGTQDTKHPNYDREVREEGFEPHNRVIDGLDEYAMEEWWKKQPRKNGYSGATYNCTHTAGDALKEGGLDKFPNRPLLPTPESFWNDLNKVLSPSGPPFKMLLGGPLPTL